VVRKEIAVKKYVVKLSDAEREQLNATINKGKHPARQLLRPRILPKADASDAGEGWSDSQIAAAPETSVDTVARTRQRLVEGGLERALKHQHSPASARDNASLTERPSMPLRRRGAQLIALALSPPPRGRAKWSPRLLEDKVVEPNIVARVSDNTIGRTPKKRSQTAPEEAVRHPAGGQLSLRGQHGRCAGCLSSIA
jgi:hypothetical protein